MPWILGTDEAGYGPNLGPLVIAGALLEVPGSANSGSPDADRWDVDSLYERLSHCISDTASDRSRCAFVDSKLLYKPGKGLERLEENVLAAASAIDSTPRWPRTWQSFWNQLTSADDRQLGELPWYADFDAELPLAAQSERIDSLSERLRSGLAESGVRIAAVHVRVVLTPEFNRSLAEMQSQGESVSKGAVLTSATLELVRTLLDDLPDGSVSIHCDKHGGRNRYMQPLQTAFPDRLIEIRAEGRSQSEYRWGPPQRRRQIRFTAKGDSQMPSALASLFAKYCREIAMQAFNAFWKRELPDIRPTAGYPVDAKRFRADIAETQKRLHISDELLWRVR